MSSPETTEWKEVQKLGLFLKIVNRFFNGFPQAVLRFFRCFTALFDVFSFCFFFF